MMIYYDLSLNSRAFLMAALFVTACLCVVGFFMAANRKRLLPKVLLPVCALACDVFVVLFATEARVVKFSRKLPEIVHAVCKMPLFICCFTLVLCFAYVTYVFVKEWNDRKRHLSRSSVKESLDKLPTGLCFYKENGRVILVNHSMDELCHMIVGRDLQNAKLFWEILSEGEVLPEVERLERGNYPSFRLPDGRVWSFSRTVLEENIFQLVAADTTTLSNINAELKLRNAELVAINTRLREYGARADEFARARERIDMKANIHRELGQALLITRRCILDDSASADAPIQIWKKNVAMLAREADFESDGTPLWQFLESAEASGVQVKISGTFPEERKQNGLFVMAAVECLVNGVRHANAHELYITVHEDVHEISVTYENDGDLPTGEIIEGGGLSSLRHRANSLGGGITVLSKPRFSLTVTIPKERSTKEWQK